MGAVAGVVGIEVDVVSGVLSVSRIRALDDDLRHSLAGGVLMMTAGVIALGRAKQLAILDAVAAFDGFHAHNDPYRFLNHN